MSVRVMSAIWDGAEADGTMLLLLLALADYSNDAGLCWPSVATLARRIRRGRRQTYDLLAEAERRGLVTRDSGGRKGEPKRSNRYTLTVPMGAAQRTGAVDRTGAADRTPPVQPAAPVPVQSTAPKPSIEPSRNRHSPPNPPRGGQRKRTPVRFSEPGSYR